MAALARELGPIDILFNCAGFVHHGTALDCSDEDWDFSFDLNVKSMHRTIRAFLPGMLERGGGSIVNIASGASSVRGIPNRYVYGASKAAVIGLTKAVAADFIRRGVRCNAICPGTVESPSLEGRIEALAARAASRWRPSARPSSPASRWAGSAAGGIATLAVYLASDESAFTTGQIHSSTAAGRCRVRAKTSAFRRRASRLREFAPIRLSKSLEFLGFSRPKRAFSMAYGRLGAQKIFCWAPLARETTAVRENARHRTFVGAHLRLFGSSGEISAGSGIPQENARLQEKHAEFGHCRRLPASISLEVGVPRPHRVGGLVEARPEPQDGELESDHLRRLEQRAHRQHREPAALVVGHRLGRDDGHDVDVPARARPPGWAVTSAVRAPACARDADERAGGRRDRRGRRRR